MENSGRAGRQSTLWEHLDDHRLDLCLFVLRRDLHVLDDDFKRDPVRAAFALDLEGIAAVQAFFVDEGVDVGVEVHCRVLLSWCLLLQ